VPDRGHQHRKPEHHTGGRDVPGRWCSGKPTESIVQHGSPSARPTRPRTSVSTTRAHRGWPASPSRGAPVWTSPGRVISRAPSVRDPMLRLTVARRIASCGRVRSSAPSAAARLAAIGSAGVRLLHPDAPERDHDGAPLGRFASFERAVTRRVSPSADERQIPEGSGRIVAPARASVRVQERLDLAKHGPRAAGVCQCQVCPAKLRAGLDRRPRHRVVSRSQPLDVRQAPSVLSIAWLREWLRHPWASRRPPRWGTRRRRPVCATRLPPSRADILTRLPNTGWVLPAESGARGSRYPARRKTDGAYRVRRRTIGDQHGPRALRSGSAMRHQVPEAASPGPVGNARCGCHSASRVGASSAASTS
jgi:hypothetical protein